MMGKLMTVTADYFRGSRGYVGSVLELPATPYEIEDALQRAHVPDGGGFGLQPFLGWPQFLHKHLILSGRKSLEELNMLAGIIDGMDEIQLGTYEGAIQLCQDEKGNDPVDVKDLINLACNLDSYEFLPGMTDDYSLGTACIMGGMLDLVDNLPDEALDLVDPKKAGEKLRKADQGTFTARGYVYRSSAAFQEVYDGRHLPDYGEQHYGLLSLRIEKSDDMDAESGVWLELPADQDALQWALTSIGEPSFDSCRIAETKSIIPAFRDLLAEDEDIGELNTLAKRLSDFPDSAFMKYKAALELEQCGGLGMALDIAANLGCYDFDSSLLSPEVYGERVLKKAGIDTYDPAFDDFDFSGYGERELEKSGLLFTPYGSISRNDREFVHEYTDPTAPEQEESVGLQLQPSLT